jgi:UDP-N-acetylglucosamine 4,6-dehydratase
MRDVDIVIHAAALKHVDVCEYNPTECVDTNVIGSINVCYAARDAGVKKLIAISTDKAVHPVSTYGASKLLMEFLLLDTNKFMGNQMKVSIVRSGNFEGSNGSVVQLWERQYHETGEITITDKDMVRFFITLGDISRFTIDRLEDMQGGEVFIPKMSMITVGELASKLYPDAKLNYIGRRPGERLVEYLFGENETPEEHDNYYVVKK